MSALRVDANHRAGVLTIKAETGESIAEVFGTREQEADYAYMFAAATDLLEALDAIIDAGHSALDHKHIDFSDALRMGRAAIAQARGEAVRP